MPALSHSVQPIRKLRPVAAQNVHGCPAKMGPLVRSDFHFPSNNLRHPFQSEMLSDPGTTMDSGFAMSARKRS